MTKTILRMLGTCLIGIMFVQGAPTAAAGNEWSATRASWLALPDGGCGAPPSPVVALPYRPRADGPDLDGVEFSNATKRSELSAVNYSGPYANSIEHPSEEGFVQAARSACKLDPAKISTNSGYFAAIAYRRNIVSKKETLVAWVWVDKWNDQYRLVLIDLPGGTRHQSTAAALISPPSGWLPIYDKYPGYWDADNSVPAEPFDKLKVMIGPNSYITNVEPLK